MGLAARAVSNGTRKIKVLIVDDSAVVRKTLEEILNADRDIEVIGTACDPIHAREIMKTVVPDVITLDVEMPRMDGITFLGKLMSQYPIPVVICSSLTEKGCATTIKALDYGAVDILLKPRIGAKKFLEEYRVRITDSVKAASHAKVKAIPAPQKAPEPKLTADAVLPLQGARAMDRTTEKVVVVGASTGGTEALRRYLQSMPYDAPGMVIVQHMPEKFTKLFAARLNDVCHIEVREAADNDSVVRGLALIAPGNHHILLKRSGARYFVAIKDGPLVCRHRPSVDVLFRSAARYAGANAVGVLMTGMGDDGAMGMLEMKQAGAYTIAQDEATCVVFGMPQEAIKMGGVDKVLPLEAIPAAVINQTSG